MARLSTEGNLANVNFPQSGGQGNSIQLSGNTLKQHGRNGELVQLALVTSRGRFFMFFLQHSESVFWNSIE